MVTVPVTWRPMPLPPMTWTTASTDPPSTGSACPSPATSVIRPVNRSTSPG